MNGRQAAKKAAERIVELEDFNKRSVATVRALYKVIEEMTEGLTPCPVCELYAECQNESKDDMGCKEFVMVDVKPMDDVTFNFQGKPMEEAKINDSTGIYGASAEG